MDPSLSGFPILSYVIGRLSTGSAISDLESIQIDDGHPQPQQDGLLNQMPHLSDPKLIASMTRAASDVSQTRSILNSLGDRPDHEAVDKAKAKLADIESALSKKLEELVLSPRPSDIDRLQWLAHLAEQEQQCCDTADKDFPKQCAVRPKSLRFRHISLTLPNWKLRFLRASIIESSRNRASLCFRRASASEAGIAAGCTFLCNVGFERCSNHMTWWRVLNPKYRQDAYKWLFLSLKTQKAAPQGFEVPEYTNPWTAPFAETQLPVPPVIPLIQIMTLLVLVDVKIWLKGITAVFG